MSRYLQCGLRAVSRGVWHAAWLPIVLAVMVSSAGVQKAGAQARTAPAARDSRSAPATPPASTTTPSTAAPMAPQGLSLLRVTPNRLEAGGTYTLTLSGHGFAPGMTLAFAPPGISVPSPVAVQSAGLAMVRVRVAAGAEPGFRTLRATVPTTAPGLGMVALPGTPLQADLVRAVEIVGAAPAGIVAPATDVASPFGAPPPDGASEAPAGGRTVLDQNIGALPLRKPAMPVMGPQVRRLVPDRWAAGKTLEVEAQGMGLTPRTQFLFGPGIEVQGTPVLHGAGRVTLVVKVSPLAAPGMRKLAVARDAGAPAVEQAASYTVQAMAIAQPVALPVPRIAALEPAKFPKGQIELASPQWKVQTASIPPPKDPVSGAALGAPQPVWSVDVPALREDQLFTWKEVNPGVAEWFEVRFYRGDALVTSRRIDPQTIGKFKGTLLPTWLRADASLVTQLITPKAAGDGKLVLSGGVPQPAAAAKIGDSSSTPPAPEAQAAALADLYWEVAGFRQYPKSGVAQSARREVSPLPILLAANGGLPPVAVPGAMEVAGKSTATVLVPVEVEISERWPLATPYRPTGLGCGQDHKGKFDLINVSKTGFGGHQTWDVMRLTGQFSLAQSPYLSKPSTSKPTFMGKVVVTTWNFDNVFVDWGDGTRQPLAIVQSGDAGTFDSTTVLSPGPQGWTHQYKEPGAYVVRVYQLANADVQGGGTAVLTAAIGEQQGLYFKAGGFDGSLGQAGAQETLAVGKSAADSAYMFYCQHVDIAPRHDPDAGGPLKLVHIDVQGFPWAAPQASAADPLAGLEKQLKGKVAEAPAGGTAAMPLGTASGLQVTPVASSLFGTGSGGSPAFSACDVSLTAGAALTYIGQGAARLRWRLGGSVFHEEVYDDIGPSPGRPDPTLAKDPAQWGPPVKGVRANLLSSPMALDQTGARELRVEAEVIYSTKHPQLYTALAQALGASGGLPDADAAKAILLGSQGGPKIGVLSPYTQSGSGLPLVHDVDGALVRVAAIPRPATYAAAGVMMPQSQPVEGALQKVAGSLAVKKSPPAFVESKPVSYQVVGHDVELPCTFEFPVAGGHFLIGGLQEGGKAKVTHDGKVFSGSGVLQLPIPGQPGKRVPLPLTFTNWTVADDGYTVEQGKLEGGPVPGGEVAASGLAYTIQKLAGSAKVKVDATLAGRLGASSLPGSTTGTSPPPWSATTAVLSPQGDWYATGVALDEIRLYDSGFRLAPKAVTIDLSASEGTAPDPACTTGGAGWTGLHFGVGATLTAYDFDLPGDSSGVVDGFAVDAKGLCGTAQLGAFSAKQYKGEFRWDGVKVEAGDGQFRARYQNLRVKVPWLDVELKGAGDPLLVAGEGVGQPGISLNLTGNAPLRKHGAISFEAQNLKLVKEEGMVPAVRSDSRFTFAGEDKAFAKDVWLKDLYFGLDGKAYFAPGTAQVTVGLAGQSGAIGQASLALDDLVVRAPAGDSARLAFEFAGKVSISKALEPAKMTVTYAIDEVASGSYAGSGPVAGSAEPFSVTFPKAEGTVKGQINAVYVPPAGGTAAALPPPLSWIPAAHAAPDTMRFKGSVDMHMFDLPVTADFALGYQGSHDFWAIKAVYEGFGPGGAPLAPPFLNVFAVGGGLGFNVSLESLKGKGLEALAYSASGGVPVFNALTTVGTPDGFTLGLRGDLSIKVAGSDPGTRIDFAAWPLTSGWSGSAPFEGYLKYQAKSFDGELWGGMTLFGGKAGVTVPKGAARLHFGGGDWYAYLGKDSGPRVQGHALFVKGNAYLMLSPAKMALGGGADMFESIGDCGDVCAYVSGNADAGMALYTAPLKLAGSTKVKVKAGGCYDDHCAGVGGKVDAYGELPSPVIRYGFAIDLPCPLPDVDLTLKVLPSPGVTPGLDWCDLNPLW